MAAFRFLRFFVCGVALFLIVDFVILICFNNYFLRDSAAFSVSKVAESSTTIIQKSIQIDPDAADFAISHDGNDLAYLEKGTIVIADLANGTKITVQAEKDMQISAIQWIYDRDRLMIAEYTVSGNRYGNFYYYDMSEKSVVKIRDNYTNKDIVIPLSAPRTISAMDMSVETNLTYFKISGNGYPNRLWESNVMASAVPLSRTVTGHIGNFACLKQTDTLFYEDTYNGKVYTYSTGQSIHIGTRTKFRILGVDRDDKLYLESMDGKTVSDIYRGSPTNNNWSELAPASISGTSEYYLTYPGDIFENLPESHVMIDLKTRNRADYMGSVIGVYDDGFLTRTGSTIAINRVAANGS